MIECVMPRNFCGKAGQFSRHLSGGHISGVGGLQGEFFRFWGHLSCP